MKRKVVWAIAALMFMGTRSTSAANLVANGDFETDVAEWVTWPGYTSGAGNDGVNPDDIAEWTGAGGRGINPVFAATNPAEIFAWPGAGGRGINPIIAGDAPFRDNGDNDTQVALLQNTAQIWQTISGLTVGNTYTLTWDYNARNCCNDTPMGELYLNDALVNVADFSDSVFPVGDVNPWYNASYQFTATASDVKVTFGSHTTTVGGDATLVLDNIALQGAGNPKNYFTNGDFEADQFPAWPGYTGGGQNAPFRDNGDNNTSVAFLQGAANLEQVVSGLVVGKTYQLSLDFNARNCCGDNPMPQVLVDGNALVDFPGPSFTDGVVPPVGGFNPWYHYTTTFTATATSLDLNIVTQSANGLDSTLIIDNVSITSAGIPGDYNNDGVLSATDIDLLTQEVQAGTNQAAFDSNGDGKVTEDDRAYWVGDLKKTYFGDANLDGQFDSDDFIEVFVVGKYETGQAAKWSEGDWDGDGVFTSGDFVAAFVAGGYEQGPRASVNAVPEPTSAILALLGLPLLRYRRGY